MPEYIVTDQVTGVKLRLVGDSPPTDQELEGLFSQYAPTTPVATQPQEVESNLFREIADIPLGLAKGVATGTRLVSDMFGADNPLSRSIKGVEGYLNDLLSAQAKADQQEVARIMSEVEDMGAGAQIRAAIRALGVSPLDFLTQGVGTIVPSLVAGAVGGTPGIIAYGASSGVGLVKDAIYEAVKTSMLEQGETEAKAEESAREAQSYTGDNLDMIAAGGLLGYASSRFGVQPAILQKKLGERLTQKGVEPAIAQAAVQKAATEESLKRGVLSNLGRTAVTEAVPEAAQAAQEQFAQNLALRRKGMDVPLMRGVVGQASLEGIVGGLIGGGVGAVEAQRADTELAERRAAAKLREPLEAEEVGVETDDSRKRLPQEEEFKDFGLPETEEVGAPGVTVDTDTLAQALRESGEEEGRVEEADPFGVEGIDPFGVEGIDPFGEDELAPEVVEAARAAEEEAEINSILRQEREAQTLTEARIAEEGVKAEPVVTAEEVVEPEIVAEEAVEPEIVTEEVVEPVVTTEEVVEPVVTTEEVVEPVVTAKEVVEPVVTTEEEVEAAPTIDPVQTPELAQELAPKRKILSLSPESKAEREAQEKAATKLAPAQAYVQPPVDLEIEGKKVTDSNRKALTRTVSNFVNTVKKGVSGILQKKGYAPFFPTQESFDLYAQNPKEQMANEVAQATQANIDAGIAPEVAAKEAQKTANKKGKVFKEIEAEKTKLQNTRLDQLYDVMVIATNPKLAGTKAQAVAIEALKTEGVTETEIKDAAVRAENTLAELARLGSIPVQKPVAPQVPTKPKPEVVGGTEIDSGMRELEQAQAQTQAVKKSDDLVSRTRLTGPVLETNTAGEAAVLIADNKALTVFERMLARTLKRFLEKTKTKFVIVTDANTLPERIKNIFVTKDGTTVTAGVYDSQTNTIYLDAVEGADSGTALHEMVHAVTLDMIYSYIKDRDSISPEAQVALDGILELMYRAQAHYAMLVETGRNTPGLDLYAQSTEGFTDLAEFVSYGITGAELQKMLLSMPPIAKGALAKIRSAFSNFVDAIASMLGVSNLQYNAFEQLIDLTGVVAEETMKGTPFKASEVVQAKNKGEKISSLAKAQAEQRTAEQFLTRGNPLLKLSRDPKTAIADLTFYAKLMGSRAYRGLLRAADSTMLATIARNKGLTMGDKLASTLGGLTVYRSKKFDIAITITKKWESFLRKNKDAVGDMFSLIHLSTLFDVLVYDVKTKSFVGVKSSIDTDPEVEDLRYQLTQLQAMTSPTQQQKTEIAKLKTALEDRIQSIRDLFVTVDSLESKTGGAQALEIYAELAAKSESDIQEMHTLLMDNIRNDPNIPGTETDVASDKGRLMAQIVVDYQEIRKLRVYFPLVRYGKYGLRGMNASGSRREFFRMFETEMERDLFVRDFGAANPTIQLIPQNLTNIGKTMRDELLADSKQLRDMFAQIDKIQTLGPEAVDTLKDTIYQMYLSTLPTGNMRKAFLHRKGVAGYDNDALRAFASNQSSTINQLSRLKFGRVIRNQIAEGRASLEGEPENTPERREKETIIDELALRAETELSPPQMDTVEAKLDAASRLGTKAGFLFMLTSIRSALIQPTQLMMFGFGTLHSEFGAGKTASMAVKYMGNFLTAKALAANEIGPTGEILNSSGQPAMRNSSYVQKSPLKDTLQKAWDYANLRNTFVATRTHDLTSMSVAEESELRMRGTGAQSGADKASKFALGVFTGPIHHIERVTREVFFMSAFELEYERRQKAGETGDAAIDAASEVAIRLTNEAMFNYSSFNKPRFAKQWYGRMGYQFMTYQVQAVSYLVGNFYKAFAASGLTKAEKKKAATKFYDLMGMGLLFGGTTGMFGYTAMVGLIDGLREALRPDVDDEDADLFYDIDDAGNPIGLRSYDLYIRNNLVPRYFGPGSALAKQLGLSPETAQMLQRGVEMGPVNILTDWNAQASLALDGLWFQGSAGKNESTEDTVINFAFDRFFGPSASIIRNFLKGYETIVNEGEIARGLEMMAPAAIREPMEAVRFATQGNVTRAGDVLKPAEYYTYWKLTGQALGFGSTEVAESQVSTYAARQMVTKIAAEKIKIYDAFEKAVNTLHKTIDKHGADSRQALVADNQMQEVLDALRAYNYKNFFDPIKPGDLSSSLRERLRRSGITDEGFYLGGGIAPFVYQIIRNSRSVENPPKETE